MAESFAQGFFRGFAEESTKENDTQIKSQLSLDNAYKLQAQKISLEQQAKIAEQHQKDQDQLANDVAFSKQKQSDIQAKMNALRGNVAQGNKTGDFSQPTSQQAMPNGIQPDAPMEGQQSQQTPSTQQHPTQEQAAPISPPGSITSNNLPPIQGQQNPAASQPAQPTPMQPPAQPQQPVAQQVQSQPMSQTSTSAQPSPAQGAMPQTSTSSQGQSTTPPEFSQPPQPQSDFNILGKQYGLSPMSWVSKNPAEYASTTIASRLNNLGIGSDPATVQRYVQAPTPQSVLNDQELRAYASIPDDKDTEKQSLMKNSPNARAWNAAHNLTTDGEPMPSAAQPTPNASLWDTTINRPYDTLPNLNKYYEQQQDKINNKNSVQYQDIIAPAETAQNKLMYLGTQNDINKFVVSGPAENTQDTYARVKAQLGNGDIEGVAAMDALAGHLLGNEKRDIFSNTKGRVTNQEAMQFFKALPDLQNSQLGRQFIITYMTGQSAQDLAVTQLKEKYRNDNNGMYDAAHASELEQAYRTANPVFTGKIDFSNPKSMLNTSIMGPDNWLAQQQGRPLNPNDALRNNLHVNEIANGQATPDNTNQSEQLKSAFKQFGL